MIFKPFTILDNYICIYVYIADHNNNKKIKNFKALGSEKRIFNPPIIPLPFLLSVKM